MIHYVIISIIVIIIIVLQIAFFKRNRKRQGELMAIFPKDCFSELMIKKSVELTETEKEIDKLNAEYEKNRDLVSSLESNNLPADHEKRLLLEQRVSYLKNTLEEIDNRIHILSSRRENLVSNSIPQIEAKSKNSVFKEILASINDYLSVNKGAASDFHLIKDVVERNCDSLEEEIATLTPIPLYLGLIGTMIGILVGVGFLIISGGLAVLISTNDSGNLGSGVEGLLGGVALAMLSSIFGILLTTTGSYFTKESKSELNRNKNTFLSWIQVKLLPTLSGNATSAIYTLQQNLNSFNNTFAVNIKDMGAVFSVVNQSHQDQLKLMQLVEKMNVTRIAKANIQVLQELQKNTVEFEKFNNYLHSVTDYLDRVQTLSSEVNEHLNRTKAIEEMGIFFKDEIKQIEDRKGAISKSVGAVDITLQNAIEKLQNSADSLLNEFLRASVIQHEKFTNTIENQHATLSATVIEQQRKFQDTIDAQRGLLQQKMEETSALLDELKNLSAVKKTLSGIEKATEAQNKKLSDLIDTIEKLAHKKITPAMETGVPSTSLKLPKLPLWFKISAVFALGIISIAGLIYIIPHFIDFISFLNL